MATRMCLGTIEQLTKVWDENGVVTGLTGAGATVSLVFAPEATVGSYVLLYAGCAVEVLDPQAAAGALELRAEAEAAGSGAA
ncbi:MAG TPA: HypC/HybG/HupF family hydrogenase formation chaperone [Gaiellaceae bacterium]|nr:HypC/HybG/HupF family hydrogenase formation chaperone [Gaiellaceae bacterium]